MFLENTLNFTKFSEPNLVSRVLRYGSTLGTPKMEPIFITVRADNFYAQKALQFNDNRQEQDNIGQLHIKNHFWIKNQNLAFGANENTNESRKKRMLSVIYAITFSLILCMNFSSVYATEEGKYANIIEENKSLLINDKNLLNQLNKNYHFLYQLGNVADWLNDMDKNVKVSPGKFVADMFISGNTEQRNHNQGKFGYKIASNVPNKKMLDKIFEWKSIGKMKGIKRASDLKKGPFRLTAIVNRMDLAGTIDDRGLEPTTAHPRSLGELHFVYTYVDDNYEQNEKEAYPETWLLSYRLPLLKREKIDWEKYVIDKNLSHEEVIVNDYLWKTQIQQWADLWINLSNFSIDSMEYKQTLSNILELVTDPENFLNVRSNTKLNDNEFELREFYLLQSKRIIPRKPRREPYKCLDKSELLAQIINHHWNYDYESLDETTHTIKVKKPDKGVKHQKGKNGYTIVRAVNRLNGYDSNEFNIHNHYSTCLKDNKKPFEMKQPDGKFNSKYDALVAPFARVTQDTLWKVPSVSEAKRHSFAMKTCSGCHSREGAVNGFHIEPRLSNKNAQLSSFLTGEGNNKFKHKNTTYEYNELARRKAWLIKFHHQEANLFDSLKTAH